MTRQRSRRDVPAVPARTSRVAIAALVLSLLGVALAAGALAVVVLRPTSSLQCRQAAWASLPAPGSLPGGWTMSASGIYIDSVGTTLSGPTPSASDAVAPAIFVSVGCYGADAHDGLLRSHVVSLSEGAVDVPFTTVGDESFATHDDASGEYTVLLRRGPLVATLAAAGSVDVADLQLAAGAVDAAMRAATSGAGSTPTIPPRPSTSPAPSPSASAASSGDTASHADPALEALLPSSVGGTSLDRESYVATAVLGTDAASAALTNELKTLGKTPDDLRIAEAFDTSGSADWYVDAFRLPGVGGAKLEAAIVDGWVSGGSSTASRTNQTIAGKRVVHVSAGGDGLSDFVYVHQDVVFDIATTDASIAKSVLAALP